LLKQFVKTDFKLRNKGSYIGLLWVIIKPLASFAIIYTVWSNIFTTDLNYKMNLLLGIILMSFYAEMMMMGMGSLLSKSYIILKINFPKDVALLSSSIVAVIDLMINMFVFFIFTLTTPINPSLIGIFLFILAVFDIYIMTLGLSTILSVLYIRFRDMFNIVELSNQLLLWLTPIYYPVTILPVFMQRAELFNPLNQIVSAARKGLITGNTVLLNDFYPLLIILAISIVFLYIGFKFFNKKVIKIAEYY